MACKLICFRMGSIPSLCESNSCRYGHQQNTGVNALGLNMAGDKDMCRKSSVLESFQCTYFAFGPGNTLQLFEGNTPQEVGKCFWWMVAIKSTYKSPHYGLNFVLISLRPKVTTFKFYNFQCLVLSVTGIFNNKHDVM
jgi:hypothetical protein